MLWYMYSMRVQKRSGEYEDVSFDKILNRMKALSFGDEFDSSLIIPSLLNQDHSIRMVRIASDAFESAMEPPMDADHLIDEVAGGTNPWQGDRYADLAPTSSSNIDRSASSQQEQLTADLIRLPLVTGIGPVAQSMACLQMLAMYFNIPFRKDVMERICTQELRDRSPIFLCWQVCVL